MPDDNTIEREWREAERALEAFGQVADAHAYCRSIRRSNPGKRPAELDLWWVRPDRQGPSPTRPESEVDKTRLYLRKLALAQADALPLAEARKLLDEYLRAVGDSHENQMEA